MTKNIIFIDSRVSNYHSFIDSLTEPYEVFVIDGESDGLSQMADYLKSKSGIDAIHVISHGSQGALYLGNSTINNDNLSSYQSQLSSVGAALAETGDILLYGCHVAQGNVGVQFIESLARYMGADVAASINATGAEEDGGDWVIEQSTGVIQAISFKGAVNVGLLSANTGPSFSGSLGKLITNFSSSTYAIGESVTLQADGKILVGGVSDGNFALARYNTNGSLDTSFDGDGTLTTSFPLDSIGRSVFSRGTSVIVQADGKILLGGSSEDQFALARYNVNGSLDTSFDGDGKLNTVVNFINGSAGFSLGLQADGKILLGGLGSLVGERFATARYNLNGSLDTSFDGDGIAITIFSQFGPGSGPGLSNFAMSVQKDGKVLLGGTGENTFALVRHNTDGSLDTSFDGDGKLTTDFGLNTYFRGTTTALQADGKILLGGYGDFKFAIARYNPDGSLDTSFDGDGKLTTSFGDNTQSYASTLYVQADGKILLSGQSNGKFALARYNQDGSLDTTFDGDGQLTTSFSSSAFGRGMTVQSDGKILVVGDSSNGFALARYNSDGSLDSSFGPVVNTLAGSPTFIEPTFSPGVAVVLAADASIQDAELRASGNYGGATLTLTRQSGPNTQDVFSSISSTLTRLTEGAFFGVDGVTIGRVTTNSAGTLKLTFNSNATQSLVNKAMQHIAYSNTSDAPPASVQIDWTFNDGNTGAQGSGGAMSVTGGTTVKITATNDPPVLGKPIPDQVLQTGFILNFKVPADAFSDPDLEVLKYSISMPDGTGLPPWISFNSATGTISGKADIADIGATTLQVTAKDAAGVAASTTMRLTVALNRAPEASNTTATTKEDTTLNGTLPVATDADGNAITYSVASAPSRGTVTISENGGYTYTPSADYNGIDSFTYKVSDLGGASNTYTVSLTITPVNDAPTGIVTIAGTPTQGQTLTASNTLVDVDGLGAISYQWSANGLPISGATGSALVLGQSQVGKTITVVASYTDGFGTSEAVASPGTPVVANVNDAPTGNVTISGNANQGQVLTAINTLADADGLGTLSYQWKAGEVVISGATSRSYTLTQAEVGKTVSVIVSYTDSFGAAESISSTATKAVSPDQQIPGTTTDDVLKGGVGNDTIDGGAGTDTASFTGKSSDYLVTFDPLTSAYSVKDTTTGRDGIDKVISIESLQFSDGTKQLATTDALLVGRLNQALFGKAPSSNSFNDSLSKVGPNGNNLEWVKAQASAISSLSDAAYATLVLNNLSITNTSLFATPTFGTPQQAYDALHSAMTGYLGLVGNASRGIVAAQLANIIAGFEGETVYGVYGGAAKAFNQQVGSNIAHSINTVNTTDIIAVPVMAAGSANATGNNFSYMLAMGNYAYQISGFGGGDKIVGPAGATANLINTSSMDGAASLQYTANGQTVSITLTGLTTTQDSELTGVSAFNTVFGVGALG